MHQKQALPWEVQQLRVSFFKTTAAQLTEREWAAVTGAQSELHEVRGVAGLERFVGPFAGAQLTAHNTIVRLDFMVDPRPSAGVPGGVPVIVPNYLAGKAEDLLSALETKIPLMCDLVPAANRIALAGMLLCPADDHVQAYRILSDLLRSVSVDPERMRDLSYGINWHTKSTAGVPINRITNWSGVVVRGVMSSLPEVQGTPQSAVVFERNYVQFVFDINSGQEIARELSPVETKAIFAELFRFARENMSDGEITQ
jgi:hypothetical protein